MIHSQKSLPCLAFVWTVWYNIRVRRPFGAERMIFTKDKTVLVVMPQDCREEISTWDFI